MISCEEAAAFFQSYLDKELSAREVLHIEEHLKACRDCAGHMAYDRALKSLVKNKSLSSQLSLDMRKLLEERLKKA